MLSISIMELSIESGGNLAKCRGVLSGVLAGNKFPSDWIADTDQQHVADRFGHRWHSRSGNGVAVSDHHQDCTVRIPRRGDFSCPARVL